MRFRAALLLVGLCLASACGGSSGSDSASVKAKADVGASGAFDSKACKDAVAGMSKVTAAIPGAMTGKAGDLEASVKEFDKFAAVAPKEIRADIKVLAVAFGKAAKVMADANFDASSGKAPTAAQMQALQSIGSSLDTKETKAASDRVSAYFEKKCGATP